MTTPPPYFSISRLVTHLGVTEGGLEVLVTQPLADGRQADSTIDQFSGVAVPQLMEGAL